MHDCRLRRHPDKGARCDRSIAGGKINADWHVMGVAISGRNDNVRTAFDPRSDEVTITIGTDLVKHIMGAGIANDDIGIGQGSLAANGNPTHKTYGLSFIMIIMIGTGG